MSSLTVWDDGQVCTWEVVITEGGATIDSRVGGGVWVRQTCLMTETDLLSGGGRLDARAASFVVHGT